MQNPPSPESLKKEYEKLFGRDKRQSGSYLPRVRDFALATQLLPMLPWRSRVLDIGSNFGQTLRAMPPTYELHGVELSKAAAEISKKFKRLNIQNEYIEKAAYQNKYFDFIMAVAVIEHLYEPMLFLKRIKELIKENGTILIMTGDYQSWNASQLGEKWFLYHAVSHIHFFSHRSLIKALEILGFRVTKTIWAGPSPFSSRLPPALGRAVHCSATSLLFPFIQGYKPYGDLMYVWSKSLTE
ncbi:MAG: hypothetical protein A4S09_00275 [Proteobacteria bacterium SG_bin7]|nr:MAG: hypothetical protein A4S09_00275 [Proteobacteria bacterium SG_bin7]